MTYLFTALMLALAGWAAWRGIEHYMFNRMLAELSGELTNSKVRRFMDGLSGRTVPNNPRLWAQLRDLQQRVAGAGAVTPEVKAEFSALLDSKGHQY